MALQQNQHEDKSIQKNPSDRPDINKFRIAVHSSILAAERSMAGQRHNGHMFGGSSDEIAENKIAFACDNADDKFIDSGGDSRHIYPLRVQGVIQQLCDQHIPESQYSGYALHHPLTIQAVRVAADHKHTISGVAAVVPQKIRREQVDEYISADRVDFVLFGVVYVDVD